MSEESPISIRDYFERVLAERQHALELTADNLKVQLDHLNALRREVMTDRAAFVSRELFDKTVEAIHAEITRLDRFQMRLVGIGIVLGVVCIVLGAFINSLVNK